MQYEWDEAKRLQNLKDHGIDFVDAHKVIDGPTFTFEDDRFNYSDVLSPSVYCKASQFQ